MALVVAGRIAPLDGAAPDKIAKGRVYVDDDGTVERVVFAGAGEPAPAGYTGAGVTVIDVGEALVLPGLIDLHNHIGFNALPLWVEPRQKDPFAHHDSWTRAASYQGCISWPAKALVQAEPEALLAYVQLRALVGGTTAIQGWPAANREHLAVVRNVDSETAGGAGRNLIYTSALTKKPLELAKMAQAQKKGAGFIYHCAEGQPGSLAAREFDDAARAGCLGPTFIGVHCTAVAAADWQRWKKTEAGALAWSPFSNLWLYGKTTDITAARKQGVRVCLGSDWGPSGTKNVLGELKVAKLVSDAEGLGLHDRELVAMLTENPGDALARAWSKPIGRLVPGAFADMTILRAPSGGGATAAWAAVVAATERDVALVIVGGQARYGDEALMRAAGARSSPLTVAGKKRSFAIPDPDKPAAAWSWKEITRRLEAVRKDPKSALERADGKRRAYAGRMDAPEAPLELVLDMPMGAQPLGANILDHADEIAIPKLPTLVHDAAFLKAVRGRGFHGGLLDGLGRYYS
ncbi:MAG: amidohydrolase family protein [Polyangiaceae bacterium]|nr:amidohydrolase family protein [Polyangiaceae bacterium]